MSIIKQYSRLSHHTITNSDSDFTTPSGSIEDFTGGTWEITDLVKSEIGVNEGNGTVSIRIGDNIKEFQMADTASSGGDSIYTTDGDLSEDRVVDASGSSLTFESTVGEQQDSIILDVTSSGNYYTGIYSENPSRAEYSSVKLKPDYLSLKTGGNIRIDGLTAHQDDATAGLAGLVEGDLYQTDGSGYTPPFNTAGVLMVKQ